MANNGGVEGWCSGQQEWGPSAVVNKGGGLVQWLT